MDRSGELAPVYGKTDEEILEWYIRARELQKWGHRYLKSRFPRVDNDTIDDMVMLALARLHSGWSGHKAKDSIPGTMSFYVKLLNWVMQDSFRAKARKAPPLNETSLFPKELNQYLSTPAPRSSLEIQSVINDLRGRTGTGRGTDRDALFDLVAHEWPTQNQLGEELGCSPFAAKLRKGAMIRKLRRDVTREYDEQARCDVLHGVGH